MTGELGMPPSPDEINSVLDLLQYAWLLGVWWIKEFMGRIKVLEERQAITPTNVEVEARVDKEISRVITKLDRMEALIIGMIQRPQTKPNIQL